MNTSLVHLPSLLPFMPLTHRAKPRKVNAFRSEYGSKIIKFILSDEAGASTEFFARKLREYEDAYEKVSVALQGAPPKPLKCENMRIVRARHRLDGGVVGAPALNIPQSFRRQLSKYLKPHPHQLN